MVIVYWALLWVNCFFMGRGIGSGEYQTAILNGVAAILMIILIVIDAPSKRNARR